jgi:hypothetical protein
LEAQRLSTIWEFLQKKVPAKQWGSLQNVEEYSWLVKSGRLKELQEEFYEKQREIENNIFKSEELTLNK